jgi:hypothetical protein
VLTAQQKLVKTTGSYYNSVARSLKSQRNALDNFKSALETQYSEVRTRSVEQWTEFNTSMTAANEAYPPPELVLE